MQFLLVQNGHQTHGWTLIGSDANGLGILEWDECAARLQPLVDQNKLKTTPNFRNRKIPRIDCNTRSCPGDEKISFKKISGKSTENVCEQWEISETNNFIR